MLFFVSIVFRVPWYSVSVKNIRVGWEETHTATVLPPPPRVFVSLLRLSLAGLRLFRSGRRVGRTQDLESTDRDMTPWLVVMMHCPWYNSNLAHQGERQAETAMRAMEPLLYQHKAAVVITGHVHGACVHTTRATGVTSRAGPCVAKRMPWKGWFCRARVSACVGAANQTLSWQKS